MVRRPEPIGQTAAWIGAEQTYPLGLDISHSENQVNSLTELGDRIVVGLVLAARESVRAREDLLPSVVVACGNEIDISRVLRQRRCLGVRVHGNDDWKRGVSRSGAQFAGLRFPDARGKRLQVRVDEPEWVPVDLCIYGSPRSWERYGADRSGEQYATHKLSRLRAIPL